jgi:DNA primase
MGLKKDLTEEVEVLVDLLRDFLGNEKQHYESKGQISFDCPVCAQEKGIDKGDGKGNLEINYFRHVYKCWSCGETHGTQGPLGRLFDNFATKKQKKLYNLVKPEDLKAQEKKKVILKLPEGYMRFSESNPRFIPHIEALRYLKNRGITDEIIEKFKIGYTVTGDFAYRIIVPSFNSEGVLNYFVARAWVNKKMKYKNPSVPKDEIIFNESLINWDKDIYLVEGAFDSFFLDNAVCMLGKKISPLLFETIYNKAKGNVIICTDGDAWNDGLRIYHELNGGILYNKIKIVKLPKDKDVCDLRGEIKDYFFDIK